MSHRFLLIQIRDPDDEIRHHEIDCFATAAGTTPDCIVVHDLLREPIEATRLQSVDCAFIGGSGQYSATGSGPWLDRALESLRQLHASGLPTFASCWGHQAMARAMGGTVQRVAEFAEVGSISLNLTEAGRTDPVFAPLPSPFVGQVGHEDSVTQLPPHTTLLASSERCLVHAYRFEDAPIYCTQFHPELTAEGLIRRIDAYPEYIERVAGVPMAVFKQQTRESAEANKLLARFVSLLLSGGNR